MYFYGQHQSRMQTLSLQQGAVLSQISFRSSNEEAVMTSPTSYPVKELTG